MFHAGTCALRAATVPATLAMAASSVDGNSVPCGSTSGLASASEICDVVKPASLLTSKKMVAEPAVIVTFIAVTIVALMPSSAAMTASSTTTPVALPTTVIVVATDARHALPPPHTPQLSMPLTQHCPFGGSGASQHTPLTSTATAAPPHTPHASNATPAAQQCPAQSNTDPAAQHEPVAASTTPAQHSPWTSTTPVAHVAVPPGGITTAVQSLPDHPSAHSH